MREVSVSGWSAFLLVATAAALVSGCGLLPTSPDGPSTVDEIKGQIQETPEPKYSIDFQTSVDGQRLTINGETDLPDGSAVTVGVHRHIDYFSEDDIRLGNRTVVLLDTDVRVREGGFAMSVTLSDAVWYEDELRLIAGKGGHFKAIPSVCFVLVKHVPAFDRDLGEPGEQEPVAQVLKEKGFELAFTESP